MKESELVTIEDLKQAATRLAPYILTTPLILNDWLSAATGARVWIKWESNQLTGSFKLRGALNKMICLKERGITRVLAVSAGNHGLGVAHAARLLNMHASVVVPKNAAATKVAAIKAYGAELIAYGESYDEAEVEARARAAQAEIEFVSPYNDREVIAGQGTVALEMLKARSFDLIIAPVGGGGLLAGCALAIADQNRKGASGQVIELLGAQPANSTAMQSSLRAGEIVTVDETPTCADGLAGNLEPGTITFPIIKSAVKDVITVSEAQIETAIFQLLKYDHAVVEGSGAVAVAALLKGELNRPNIDIGIVISGRNIDIARLHEICKKHIGN